LDLRDDYLIYTCWAARIQDPEECPVEDLRQCLTFLQDNLGIDFDITELYDEITSDANTKGFLKAVCIAASENDVESVKELFESLDAEKRGIALDFDCDTYGGPTPEPREMEGFPCYAVPTDQYAAYSVSITGLIDGQDYAGGRASYNDEIFIKQVLDFQENSKNVGTYIGMLLMNYYWPKNIPLPIRGSPETEGIISGQLFDSMTEYPWTQQYRGNFPYTSLLTSQSIEHGLSALPQGNCQEYITKYFQTGVIDWVDGTVCGDPYPYFNNLVD